MADSLLQQNLTLRAVIHGQRLLSYIICPRFLILRSENSSWLMHLPATLGLAGIKNRGLLLLSRDFISIKELEGLLYLLQKKNDLRHYSKLLLSTLIKLNLKFFYENVNLK